MNLTAFADEIEKLAGSRLRGAVSVVRDRSMWPIRRYNMTFGAQARPIGQVDILGGHIRSSRIDPEFQGMGLGKKLYGEVTKAEGGVIKSDPHVLSDQAKNVYESAARRPDWDVQFKPSSRWDPLARFLRHSGHPRHRGGHYEARLRHMQKTGG